MPSKLSKISSQDSAPTLPALPNRRMEAWKWTDLYGSIPKETFGLARTGEPHFDIPDVLSLLENEDVPAQDNLVTLDLPMTKLAAHFTPKLWQLNLGAGMKPDTPLVISRLLQGHCRISLALGQGASLTLIEHYEGQIGGFSNLALNIELKEGASLTRIVIHEDPDSHSRVSTAHLFADENASLTQHSLSYGGAISRLETHLIVSGRNVKAVINGAYLLRDNRHCDMTSLVQLGAEGAHIRQNVKGVVGGTARGVFQGKFYVEPTAQDTDAQMRHDALMISDSAQIRAKPELEIYADDVACAHGNTVGDLDPDMLFYLRQRGLSKDQAEAILTRAFVTEIFDGIEDKDLKKSLLEKISTWLKIDPPNSAEPENIEAESLRV